MVGLNYYTLESIVTEERQTRLIKAQTKRVAAGFGLSNVVRRESSAAGAQSGPNPSCSECGTWKSRCSRLGGSKASRPQGRPRGDGNERIEQAKAGL